MGTEASMQVRPNDGADPLQESMSTAAGRSAQFERAYDEAIKHLGFTFQGLEYSSAGHTPNRRLENLLTQLRESGSGDIASVHTNLRSYVEGYAGLSMPARYAIQHDDATLLNFMRCSRAIEALTDLRKNQEAPSEDLESALSGTARIWLELGDRLFELDKLAQERGIQLDSADATAEYERQLQESDASLQVSDRTAQEPAKVEDSFPSDDSRETEDEDNQDEDYQVEDVANWIGPKGTWT